MATKHALILVALLTSACGKRDNVPCAQDSNCDLATGGVCTAGGSARWCAYPDQACSSGYRYSTQAVGDSLSGDCVVEPDASIDNLPDWIVAHGGIGNDYGNDLVEAPNGDLVMVGGLAGTISLGGGALAGGPAWVARYRADGGHIWSKIVSDNAHTSRVAVDGRGDVYVLGLTRGAVDFGGGIRTAPFGMFVVKLDGADGHYLWDRTTEVTNGYLDVMDIKVFGDSIAVCGDFQNVDLGNGPLHSDFGRDHAIVVYDSASGAYRWQRAMLTTDEEDGPCTMVSIGDDIVVTADATGTAMLGGDPIAPKGGSYTVLARYRASDGAHVWSLGLGGGAAADVWPWQLVTDGTRLFVGGQFSSASINFGGGDIPAPPSPASSGSSRRSMLPMGHTYGLSQWVMLSTTSPRTPHS